MEENTYVLIKQTPESAAHTDIEVSTGYIHCLHAILLSSLS